MTAAEFAKDVSIITSNGICKGKRGGVKSKKNYLNIITAFDIETSNIPIPSLTESAEYQNIMYIWKWQFGPELTIVGRTWEEYKMVVEAIIEQITTPELVDILLVCYVHNLSYDGYYLTGVLDFAPEDIFFVKPRKILKMTYAGKIEFRCSYLHSNMSLSEYARKFNAPHQKLSGREYDYSKVRYPWTELNEYEDAYTDNDVIALVETLQIEMAHDNDTLQTIPLTSTGYLRREVRAALAFMRSTIRALLPNEELYTELRQAFRGGDTHANRYYAGYILHNVHSYDRASSYPDVQCNELFPITPFRKQDEMSPDELEEEIYKRGSACVFVLRMWDVELKDPYWGFPYIPKDKCRYLEKGEYDNGRVLKADYLEITITDIDYKIISETYTTSATAVESVWKARYGKLPSAYTNIMRKYFKAKTSLKGVEGEEIYYIKSKNKINSGYGMSAQDPGKGRITMEETEEGIDFIEDGRTISDRLKEFNATMPYQWGVWTTAHARNELYKMQKIAHPYGAYSDTDSCKTVREIDYSAYNAERERKSKATNSFGTTREGRIEYMGVCEYEGCSDEFITLGAKKYALSKDGQIKITVAGVNKKEGGKELEKRGGLAAFKKGFVFRESGGTSIKYNDCPAEVELNYNGKSYGKITRNIVLLPSYYTLGITGEYEKLIEGNEFFLDSID